MNKVQKKKKKMARSHMTSYHGSSPGLGRLKNMPVTCAFVPQVPKAEWKRKDCSIAIPIEGCSLSLSLSFTHFLVSAYTLQQNFFFSKIIYFLTHGKHIHSIICAQLAQLFTNEFQITTALIF